MNNTIKSNIPFFLGRVKGDATYNTVLLDLATVITAEQAEEIVKKIPERFQELTQNEISRFTEMAILELIIKDTLEINDSRFGTLQYYARKRLLELHNNPKNYDSNSNSELPETNSNV